MRTMAWRRPFLPAKGNEISKYPMRQKERKEKRPTIGTSVRKKVDEPLGHT